MITKKEDLKGKYVERGNKEIVELFLDACEKFGLKWHGGDNPREFEPYMSRIGVEFDLTLRQGFVGDCYSPLTLSDLKPRTHTKYEKVTESASHVIDEFENGGEFYYMAPSLTKPALANRGGVFNKLRDGDVLYRKVKKEIDWRDDVYEWQHTAKVGIYTPLDFTVAHLISAHPGKFLELCRVALRANGELD